MFSDGEPFHQIASDTVSATTIGVCNFTVIYRPEPKKDSVVVKAVVELKDGTSHEYQASISILYPQNIWTKDTLSITLAEADTLSVDLASNLSEIHRKESPVFGTIGGIAALNGQTIRLSSESHTIGTYYSNVFAESHGVLDTMVMKVAIKSGDYHINISIDGDGEGEFKLSSAGPYQIGGYRRC